MIWSGTTGLADWILLSLLTALAATATILARRRGRHATRRTEDTRAPFPRTRGNTGDTTLLRVQQGPAPIPYALALVTLVSSCAIFVTLATQVLHEGPTTGADVLIARWLHTHASEVWTRLMLLATFIGSPPCVAGLTVYTTIVLGLYRRWYDLVLLTLVMSGGGILIPALKLSFQRARPLFESPLAQATGYSFPSGHAILAVLLYGILAYLAMRTARRTAARLAVVLAASAMIAAIDFSRIYLGVHYLSDILAGTAAGIAWMVLCILAVHAVRRFHPRAQAQFW